MTSLVCHVLSNTLFLVPVFDLLHPRSIISPIKLRVHSITDPLHAKLILMLLLTTGKHESEGVNIIAVHLPIYYRGILAMSRKVEMEVYI